MNEESYKQEQGTNDGREESVLARSLPAHLAPRVSGQGEGSWTNLLAFLEVSPDALVLVSAFGRVEAVNSRAEALFGYPRAELEGQPLEVLLPERFRAAHVLHRERFTTSPRARPMGIGLQLFGQRKDGSEVPVDISLGPLQLDGALHVLAAIRDISERRRLEQLEREVHTQMGARLALLQLILDELPSGIFLVRGPEARLVLANHAMGTVFGATWTPGQPLGAFLAQHGIRILGTDGRSLAPEQLPVYRAVREGETVRHQQQVIRQADGTALPILVNAVALDGRGVPQGAEPAAPGPGGSERAALVVYQDVTALKEAEALKDHLLGLVAHELRTPLSALKGFVQTLLFHTTRGRGATLADWQQEALVEIDLATDRLDRLTVDLLDVVRLQGGRLVLHRESIDLVALCQRVIARMGQVSSRHQLTLSTSLPRLVAQVDGGRIEQVLSNLLTNAIKYSPNGGMVEVTLSLERERQTVLLSVRDQGIGIPQAEQAQLFGRFVRASNAESQGISGTGLGLYLCRELVEQHGGQIWFESTEGVGSTFFVRLPLLPERLMPEASEHTSITERSRTA